ncbi:MAG TPA: C40 family peptidase [Ferruginibacter sp.]|nr:C40 family peptidase [Ferruginibacter sp.]
MKHLFFVSVALGIFSGTSISANAQTSVNSTRAGDGIAAKKSEKFIEGIEIKQGNAAPEPPVAKRSTEIITANPAFVKDESSSIEMSSPVRFKYALLLDVEVEGITNYTLYNFIEKWWATTYRYGGSTQKGVDCSAYTATLLSDVYDIATPRISREQYKACEKIGKDDLQEGDLVFFNTRGRRNKGVSHVGVYLRNGYFTHSSVGNGVTISHLDETYYSKKYIGAGRMPANTIGK